MSRTPSKGTGTRRTIYLPTDLIRSMGIAMAEVQDPVVNHFICEAIRAYCTQIHDNVKEADRNGSEEA